jgi:hypothetical protein
MSINLPIQVFTTDRFAPETRQLGKRYRRIRLDIQPQIESNDRTRSSPKQSPGAEPMNPIEPEEYPNDTQKAEVLAEPDRTLEDNNFDEPLEDLKEYSESYSMLMGLVTIETQVTSRSLTHKKQSVDSADCT